MLSRLVSSGAIALCVFSGCSLSRGTLGTPNADGAVDPIDAYVADDGGIDAPSLPDAGHATCGDGFVDPIELCDDGNTRDGDGCSGDCSHVEPGYVCNGRPSICTATRCGDGVRAGTEQCDGGPGCTACVADTMQVVTRGPALAAAIPDDHYDGTIASMTCVDLAAMLFPLDHIAAVQVTVGMHHTYIGDLTIKLLSPAGTVVTLMSRPGLNEAHDDGTDMNGDGSELDPGYPITFVTGAPTSSEDMGATISGTQIVCKDDRLCSFAPSHGAALAGDLTTFVNDSVETVHGTWRFCAADGAGADTGSIESVTLTFTLD